MTQDALKLARLRDDDSDDELSPLCKSIVDGTHADVKPRRSRDADMISELAARITRLEAANKRAAKKSTVSKRDFDFAIETIGGFVGKEIRPILERIEKLEAQSSGVRWAGVWHQDMRCNEGELVTDKGSLWICTAPSNDRPGDNASAFRLIVKNGHATDGTRRHTTGTREVSNGSRS